MPQSTVNRIWSDSLVILLLFYKHYSSMNESYESKGGNCKRWWGYEHHCASTAWKGIGTSYGIQYVHRHTPSLIVANGISMAPDDRIWSFGAICTRILRKSAACLLNGAVHSRLFVSHKWRRFFETATLKKGTLFLALLRTSHPQKHSTLFLLHNTATVGLKK